MAYLIPIVESRVFSANVIAASVRTSQSLDRLQPITYASHVTPPDLLDTIDDKSPVITPSNAMVQGIAWSSGGVLW